MLIVSNLAYSLTDSTNLIAELSNVKFKEILTQMTNILLKAHLSCKIPN
jgi:hypothetical protein